MITESPRDEVILTGSRFRASYLLEQYGYTLNAGKYNMAVLNRNRHKKQSTDGAKSEGGKTGA